jgi:hypothetical protein
MTPPHPENPEKTGYFPESGAESGASSPLPQAMPDPDFARLLTLWPQLTDRQRRRLLRLAERIATVS